LYVSELSEEAHLATQLKPQLKQRLKALKCARVDLTKKRKVDAAARKKQLRQRYSEEMAGMDATFATDILPHKTQRVSLGEQRRCLELEKGKLKGKRDRESVAERKRLQAEVSSIQKRVKGLEAAIKERRERHKIEKREAKAQQKSAGGPTQVPPTESDTELAPIEADFQLASEYMKVIQPSRSKKQDKQQRRRRGKQLVLEDEKLREWLDQQWQTYPTLRAAIRETVALGDSLLHTVETTRFQRLAQHRHVYRQAMHELKNLSVDDELFRKTNAFGESQAQGGGVGWFSMARAFMFGVAQDSSAVPQTDWFGEG
jgi:hypothetical protein